MSGAQSKLPKVQLLERKYSQLAVELTAGRKEYISLKKQSLEGMVLLNQNLDKLDKQLTEIKTEIMGIYQELQAIYNNHPSNKHNKGIKQEPKVFQIIS